MLRWRHSTLDLARERARDAAACAGAAFPWRTIRGPGVLGLLAGRHRRVPHRRRHRRRGAALLQATGDEAFAREVGLELLVETARLWRSLGHHDRHGRFHIDGVTGPDEYSALGDDNVYTNLMAARNLPPPPSCAPRYPTWRDRLGVDDEEAAAVAGRRRRRCTSRTTPSSACTSSREGFTRLPGVGLRRHPGRRTTRCCCTCPYFDLYRKQVVKQADLVLAMHWRGDAFTAEQKARNFAYYEARTVRDSSLSACTQAVLAAEVGHLELAHDYLARGGPVDLRDLHRNTRDGVHIASLAGAWIAPRRRARRHARPRRPARRSRRGCPRRIDRLEFSVRWRGLRLRVTVHATEATYTLRDGGTDALSSPTTASRVTLAARGRSRDQPPSRRRSPAAPHRRSSRPAGHPARRAELLARRRSLRPRP